MIRIGLLGAARIAPKGIVSPAAKRSDCEIVAVGCRSREKGERFVVDNKLTAEVMDYEALCNRSDLDMIYIALPPSEHAKWACLAMKNGKHILCEKPAAMGIEDARVMAEVSRKTGQYFFEAFHYQFHPAFENCRSDMKTHFKREGGFNFEALFTASIPNTANQLRYKAELGGGALMDLGCYALHAVRQLFGEMNIVSVEADIEDGVDVALTAHLSTPNGRGKIYCNMRDGAPREDYIRAQNSVGARMELTNFVAPYRGYNYMLTAGETFIQHHEAATELTTYDYQLGHFLSVLQKTQPALPLSDMTAQAQTIEAIYQEVGLR